MANYTTETGTINSVTVYASVKAWGAFGTNIDPPSLARLQLYGNNTMVNGTSQGYTKTSWTYVSQTWTTNPYNESNAWTWSDIDEMEAGVGFSGWRKGEYAACTQVYVEVNYSSHIYVCDDSAAQAYEGHAADGAFNNDVAEFTSGDYNNIKVDDNNYVDDYEEQYQYHRFDFTIDENMGDITQIDITWKGWGGLYDFTGGTWANYGYNLWVKDSGSWSEKDSGTQSSKETLTAQKTSSFSDWVSAGHLECAAQSDYAGNAMIGTNSRLLSYYVEVKIYCGTYFTLFHTNSSVSSGSTVKAVADFATSSYTDYWWYVNVTDGALYNQSETYHMRTGGPSSLYLIDSATRFLKSVFLEAEIFNPLPINIC